MLSKHRLVAYRGRYLKTCREGGRYYLKHDWLTYYRHTDGWPAVQLGAGLMSTSIAFRSEPSHSLENGLRSDYQ